MEIDLWYWISEYGKVFCGYLFLMLLWPLVVFHGYLKGKSKTFCFGFCTAVTVVIANTAVLGLGLFHILDQWLIRLGFYGVFAGALFKNTAGYLDRKYKKMMEAKFPDFRVLYGKYRVLVIVILFFGVSYTYIKKVIHCLSFHYIKKSLQPGNWLKIKVQIKEFIWNLGRRAARLFWKYGLLLAVMVFGMMYFSYGAFKVCSYGVGDLYTHHKWIYGLIEGELFVEGIYPAGMHCFTYCLNTLFGIRVYSILLFLQGIHVAVFFLAVYLLLKKIFHWYYTPVFVLLLFQVLDLKNVDQVRGMFRLQMTMPQEFGLYTVCLCALWLANYLEDDPVAGGNGKASRFHWNGNLLLFTLSLTAALATHFFVVIMAVVICLPFALFGLKKLFSGKHFVSLVVSVLCAFLIAILPMAGAMAQGTGLNPSLNWAVKAMDGEEIRQARTQNAENASGGKPVKWEDEGNGEVTLTVYAARALTKIYKEGYVALYGVRRAGCILLVMAAVAVFCLIGRWRSKYMGKVCMWYPSVMVSSVCYVALYAFPMMGLPDLIPEGRFLAVGHMMVLGVLVMPIDILFSGLMCFCGKQILRILSLAVAGGIYGGTILFGCFRGYLFYELSRYNSAAETTCRIIDTFPQYSYTIVSPTDELYPVIETGWHEELLTFVEKSQEEEYTLPSEYVFLFVEKKPILYAQAYFFEGPWWMGTEKYLSLYASGRAVQSPELISSQISQELAQTEITDPYLRQLYLQLETRAILESKVYDWCQWFARENPSALNIYYEDDVFICYYFRQDVDGTPYHLNRRIQSENGSQ